MVLVRKLVVVLLAGVLVLAGTAACKKAEPAAESTTTAVESDTAGTMASDEPAPTAEELAAAEGVQDIFANGDDTAVTAGAEGPTFPLVEPMTVTAIVTLHVGEVAAGTLSLKDANGKTWGPWKVQTDVAPDGNTYWSCAPDAALPVGDYTVVDSDPDTWAKNDGSDGFGFVTVQGVVE